jgi:hypothetical protein
VHVIFPGALDKPAARRRRWVAAGDAIALPGVCAAVAIET